VVTQVNLRHVRDHLLAGRILLTPGLRLARQITQAFLTEQLADRQRAVGPPQVHAIDAWLEARWQQCVEAGQLPEARLLSRLEEHWLWQEIITADRDAAEGFSLLQPVLAAEQALQARHEWLMHGGNFDDSAQRQQFLYEPDCAAFLRWCGQFQRRIAAQGLRTRADAYRELLTVEPESTSEIVLSQVIALPTLTRTLLNHLGQVLPDAGLGLNAGEPVSGQAYGSLSDELASVAAWAAERHRNGTGSTAIVLFDFYRDRPLLEYYLRQQFGCLGQRYAALPVNFSAGMPLGRTPLFRDALLGLRVLAYQSVSRGDALALLQSPFLTAGEPIDSQALLALRQALTDLSTDPIDWADLGHFARTLAPGSAVASVITGFQGRGALGGRRLPSAWLPSLYQGLRLWKWPGRLTLDSLEYQQFDRFEGSIDTLVALDAVVGKVTFTQLLDVWERLLDDVIFQPKTEDTAVQVLGPREALGLSFDAVWICGLEAGVWPQSPQHLAFLPAALQRRLGMRHLCPEQLNNEAWAMLSSWRASHGELRGSFARFQDGLEVLPSPLLAVASDLSPALPSDRPSHWLEAVPVEALEDHQAPVAGDVMPWGGGATVIANQSNCPFRAWVTHRLGATGVAEPVLGLSPMERGNVVHYALEHLWNVLGSSEALKASTTAERQALISAAVEAALQRLDRPRGQPQGTVRKRVGSPCFDLERTRVTELLAHWLQLETERPQGFRVVEQEDAHTLPLGSLELKLRPDRIDELDDGRRVVIDYKTGTVSRSNWLDERPREPQLPLYSLLDASVEGLTYARLHADGCEFLSLGDALGLTQHEKNTVDQLKRTADADAGSWAELQDRWRQRLMGLAEEYVQGHAAIAPQRGACQYCPLGSVCRFAESDRQSGRAAAVDEAELW